MRDADIDLVRLQARKDAIIARFQARAHVWQAVQGAALAALGFGVAGVAQGLLSRSQFLVIGASAALAMVVAVILLAHQERAFEASINDIDQGMEMLKKGGAP